MVMCMLSLNFVTNTTALVYVDNINHAEYWFFIFCMIHSLQNINFNLNGTFLRTSKCTVIKECSRMFVLKACSSNCKK